MKNIEKLFKKVPRKPKKPQKPDKPREFLEIDRSVKFGIYEGDNLGEKFSYIKESLKEKFHFKSNEFKDLFEQGFNIKDIDFAKYLDYGGYEENFFVVGSDVLEKYFVGETNPRFKTEIKRYEQKLSQFKKKEKEYEEDLKKWEKEKREIEEYNKKLEEKIGQLIEDVVK